MSNKQVIQLPGLKTIGPHSQAVRAAGLLLNARYSTPLSSPGLIEGAPPIKH